MEVFHHLQLVEGWEMARLLAKLLLGCFLGLGLVPRRAERFVGCCGKRQENPLMLQIECHLLSRRLDLHWEHNLQDRLR